MKLKLLTLGLFLCFCTAQSQEYFPKNDGVKSRNTNYTVFKNAKIHLDAKNVLEKGMFAIREGRITAVAKSINIPKNSIVIDLEGKEVYPSFIDLYTDFGIPKPKRAENGNGPQYDAGREGYYWNDHIRPDTEAIAEFSFDSKEAEKLHKAGFGVVNTHVPDGIVRGTGMLVALTPEVSEGDRILDERSSQYLSFEKSVKSRQSYPTSTMGTMALLRQAYLDAEWYARGNAKNKDLALEALNKNKNLVQIFATDNLLNEFRADKVGDEFGIQYVIVGSGNEYQRINEVKASNATYIVPLKFPDAFDVEDPYLANLLSLEEMREWNQAPANLKVLSENKVPFALTTNSIDPEKDFRTNLLKAVEYGLTKEAALAALTTIPAKTIGKEGKLGVIQEGAWANFLITSGDYFEKETTLYENWIQGEKKVLNSMDVTNITGNYDLKIDNNTYSLNISGEPSSPKTDVKLGETKIGSKISFNDNWMNLLLSSPDTTKTEFIRLVANIPSKTDTFSGKAILPDGKETRFQAVRKESTDKDKKDKKKKEDKTRSIVAVTYPNVAYGFKNQPEQQNVLFKNATVWTSEETGVLENTDVLVKNGEIVNVGQGLSAGGARVIDATGKHLTAGIIDEHSHIAASAINESGHNSSAEVTMEDVVDPTDINIYRNLAGGVTTIQLLHGSANPIGGRSAILKLKWGESADDMIFEQAPPFIKFALGENVKQSNWSGSRFPQTRMGVEQVFTDYFSRGRAYENSRNEENFRKDLEMETIVEILNGERFVTSHSYIQSEINMLMKVAEKFGFNINTFTHILEGYKVADKMKEHGVGASTFSDWWAYKYEVNDAIPYNAAIMNEVGLTVAINSDDGEMSRRLNQEAAKSVKYGGMSEEEAWKMVTINPAKLLHIDKLTGSIREGKQADLVLWNEHPLSIYAKPEKTMVDGVIYFDLERDSQMRADIRKERNELIGQMLKAKNNGVKTQPVIKKEEQRVHCDLLEEVK
ncbi:amidohydrolase family protein [Christiangramia sabulilitoris]|uniref:Amidohydrolase family protein n=1 Tax=Christiangramia sabulilitoris TaxID=2583991 RepID=A0A550I7D6_9FLAO|nr:amidohydrolase family protein [Christiangramia sabulilitoris]TRO66890.1 amidohydrolase family protein [Christiangramia sabulilitoris]